MKLNPHSFPRSEVHLRALLPHYTVMAAMARVSRRPEVQMDKTTPDPEGKSCCPACGRRRKANRFRQALLLVLTFVILQTTILSYEQFYIRVLEVSGFIT